MSIDVRNGGVVVTCTVDKCIGATFLAYDAQWVYKAKAKGWTVYPDRQLCPDHTARREPRWEDDE